MITKPPVNWLGLIGKLAVTALEAADSSKAAPRRVGFGSAPARPATPVAKPAAQNQCKC